MILIIVDGSNVMPKLDINPIPPNFCHKGMGGLVDLFYDDKYIIILSLRMMGGAKVVIIMDAPTTFLCHVGTFSVSKFEGFLTFPILGIYALRDIHRMTWVIVTIT